MPAGTENKIPLDDTNQIKAPYPYDQQDSNNFGILSAIGVNGEMVEMALALKISRQSHSDTGYTWLPCGTTRGAD